MKSSTKILIALGAGLVAGGILGILFAPFKGSETRRKMADSGKKFSDAIKKKIADARANGENERSRITALAEEEV